MDNLYLKAIIIAVVEGVTEFLPVSSTGHMILVGDWISFVGEREKTFSIAIQLGAITSVLVLMWPRFAACLPFKRQRTSAVHHCMNLALACLPAFVVGFFAHSYIKEHLFFPLSVAWALIVGALLMLMIDKASPVERTPIAITSISHRQAFLVGIAQCVALWPGFSRSAATILGGLLVGLSRRAATEFSFIVAVPIMVAATLYDLYKSYSLLSSEDIPLFALGMFVAFLTALVSVKALLFIVSRHTLHPFAYYRLALGALVLCLLWIR